MLIDADVEKLEQPRTFSLPIESDDGSSESLAPDRLHRRHGGGAPDGNEVASSSPSTGTLRVTRASCDPTPVLQHEVDATLASEEQTDDGQSRQSLELEGFVR